MRVTDLLGSDRRADKKTHFSKSTNFFLIQSMIDVPYLWKHIQWEVSSKI